MTSASDSVCDAKAVNQRAFFLKPVSPFRLDLTVWAVRRGAENAVGTPQTLRLWVCLRGKPIDAKMRQAATSALES